MKILNLYAGIGGNRFAFGDGHEVTAYEIDPDIAAEYRRNFPDDKVIVGDAHEALIKEIDNRYDFIWSSPPCQTHSKLVCSLWNRSNYKRRYPDMSLYQEILLLRNFAPLGTYYCVENVIPYHTQLIPPTEKIGRHIFWCNFRLKGLFTPFESEHKGREKQDIARIKGLPMPQSKNARLLLRNACNPKIAKHIFDCLPIHNHQQETNDE